MPSTRRVTVTVWCTNPADSVSALFHWVTTDSGKISNALKSRPWISPKLLEAHADSFQKEICAHGGKAS